MKECVRVWLKNARKGVCHEGCQRLEVALVAVTGCAQRYQLLGVVPAVAQGCWVVQFQDVVVRVTQVATLGTSVLVFGEDCFFGRQQ